MEKENASNETTEQAETVVEAKEEPKKTIKRTTRKTKKADEEPKEEAKTEEEPKKRKPRTTRKKVEAEAAEESAKDADTEKPAKKTTRRTKKADTEAEAKTDDKKEVATEKTDVKKDTQAAEKKPESVASESDNEQKSDNKSSNKSENQEKSDKQEQSHHHRDNQHDNKHHKYNKKNRNKNQHKKHEKSKPVKTRYLELLKETPDNIRQLAVEHEIPNMVSMTFSELTLQVFKAIVEKEAPGLSVSQGILEILQDGYGFLRRQMCTIDQGDVYVSNAQIKKLGLKTGDFIVGQTRSPKDNESYQALLRVECINDMEPEKAKKAPSFDSLVPLYPNQKFNLHTEAKDPSVRIVDIVTPIGKGQRGLIVAPPKAGKTTLLKQIANALTSNHPDLVLFVLLIDERPEEVTDMTRSIEGDVIASTFDQHLTNHIRVSEMVLERAKRLVEQGKDVVILLDSITRLARAYNIAVPSSGQTLSGGVNPLALYKPKKFFGSARNIEFGGSLTILATALIDTGSKMDDVIFEEFKGTGNSELHLDRMLFNKRIFPAINLSKSSTRREELLVNQEALKGMTILRRVFETVSTQEAIELLKKQAKQSRTNEQLFGQLIKQSQM
jgi:transcription termination factor Rho